MDKLVDQLLTYGPLGLFCIYLIYCRIQDGKRYDAQTKSMNEIQECRAAERAENAKALTEHAEASKSLTATVTAAIATMAAHTRSQERPR